MNAKEKAKEIFGNMYDVDKGKGAGNYINYDYAKQCAKICCDELIAENKVFPYNSVFQERLSFWKKVKKEIELL